MVKAVAYALVFAPGVALWAYVIYLDIKERS